LCHCMWFREQSKRSRGSKSNKKVEKKLRSTETKYTDRIKE